MSPAYDYLCRVCADKNQNSDDIFENNDAEMAKLIYKYLSITIDMLDEISTKICQTCKEKISDFHDFALRCERAQNFLTTHKSNIEDHNIKLELDVKCEVKEEQKYNDDDDDDENYEESINWSLMEIDDKKLKTEIDPLIKPKKLKRKSKKKDFSVKKVKRRKVAESDDFKKPLVESLDKDVDHEGNKILQINGNNINIKEKIKDVETINEILKFGENNNVDIKTMNLSRRSLKKAYLCQMFNFICHVCDMKFNEWNLLKSHTKSEHQTNPEVLCVCLKKLLTAQSIQRHWRKHNPNKSFKCSYCSKTFCTRKECDTHTKIHLANESKEHVCDECGKAFSSPRAVVRHKKLHEPFEKRFVWECKFCDKKFANKFVLKHHIEVVHEKFRPFVCDLCGHSFSTRTNLTEHRSTHGAEMKFVCDICNRGFKLKRGLKRHMETHSTVTYPCPHCPMILNSQRTFRNHLYIHDENSRHPCPFCGKTFKRRKDVAIHKKVHTGERPYSCPWCSRTFANGSNCRSHKRRMHPHELRISDAKAAMKNKIIKPHDAKTDEEKIDTENTTPKTIFPVEKQKLAVTSSPENKIPNLKSEMANLSKLAKSSPSSVYEPKLSPLNLNTSGSNVKCKDLKSESTSLIGSPVHNLSNSNSFNGNMVRMNSHQLNFPISNDVQMFSKSNQMYNNYGSNYIPVSAQFTNNNIPYRENN